MVHWGHGKVTRKADGERVIDDEAEERQESKQVQDGRSGIIVLNAKEVILCIKHKMTKTWLVLIKEKIFI